MSIVVKKSRETWGYVGIICCATALAIFISVVYYQWPPKFNPDWVIGGLVGCGTAFGLVSNTVSIIYNYPYKFEVTETEIIITDSGFLKPQIRKFMAKNVSKIYYSSENASYIETSDGKEHYIDMLLMYKRFEIKKIVKRHFDHIRFVGMD